MCVSEKRLKTSHQPRSQVPLLLAPGEKEEPGNEIVQARYHKRPFAHDVTAAIFVYKTMNRRPCLCTKKNHVEIELFSHVKTFLLFQAIDHATWLKTIYWPATFQTAHFIGPYNLHYLLLSGIGALLCHHPYCFPSQSQIWIGIGAGLPHYQPVEKACSRERLCIVRKYREDSVVYFSKSLTQICFDLSAQLKKQSIFLKLHKYF